MPITELDIDQLDYVALVALRDRVDRRIEELRRAAAEHYGLAIPRKRTGRQRKTQVNHYDPGTSHDAG